MLYKNGTNNMDEKTIINEIIKDQAIINRINIKYVNTKDHIDLSQFTDEPDLAEEKFIFPDHFHGVFICPGSFNIYTILIDDNIKTGDLSQFYDTLSHELYHLIFYIANYKKENLKNDKIIRAYRFLDEFFARYSAYKFIYNNKLSNYSFFSDMDIEPYETNCAKRVKKYPSDYEVVNLLATMIFISNERKMQVDFQKSFASIYNSDFEILIKMLNSFSGKCTNNFLLDLSNVLEKINLL